MSDTASSGALTGIRVADFSRVLAGPYATMMLADFGADVIKIESPDGDDTRAWTPPVDASGQSTYFGAVNRNKRSVVCDLRTPEGLAEARAIAATADVIVENFRPGVMDRYGLDCRDTAGGESRSRLLLDLRLRPERARRSRGTTCSCRPSAGS